MNWTAKALNKLPIKAGFRLRGIEMTRLETFTDAAFAFATTMLVISTGTIPGTYAELTAALKGVPTFAASFLSLASLWLAHRKWSRRYGLEDMASTIISLALVFIMLIYVYPLKMIFGALFDWISNAWLPSSFKLESNEELINLFVIYGVGFFGLVLMIVLLYWHALRSSTLLGMNELEVLQTKQDVVQNFILALTGLASAVYALIVPIKAGVFAGFVYMTLPVTMTVISLRYSKKIKFLRTPKRGEGA